MKKLLILLSLIALFFASTAFGAGSVTTTVTTGAPNGMVVVTMVMTGDAGAGALTGTVPDTSVPTEAITYMTRQSPYYLYRVMAYPTAGGTAPDAADVFVKDANSLDLLGSEDGTTAYAGLTLIHATLPRSTFPNMYLPRAGAHVNYYPEVTGALTVSVANQATASANWTIKLIFIK